MHWDGRKWLRNSTVRGKWLPDLLAQWSKLAGKTKGCLEAVLVPWWLWSLGICPSPSFRVSIFRIGCPCLCSKTQLLSVSVLWSDWLCTTSSWRQNGFCLQWKSWIRKKLKVDLNSLQGFQCYSSLVLIASLHRWLIKHSKCCRPGSPLCGLGALSSLLAGGYLISSSSFCFVLISTASLALAAVLQNPVYTSSGGSINVLCPFTHLPSKTGGVRTSPQGCPSCSSPELCQWNSYCTLTFCTVLRLKKKRSERCSSSH